MSQRLIQTLGRNVLAISTRPAPGRTYCREPSIDFYCQRILVPLSSRNNQQKPSSKVAGVTHRKYASSAVEKSGLRKTTLYDIHTKNGATMVPFGGYHMPVQYKDLGVGQSHEWTRQKASIFDVSHMVQHSIKGSGAEGLLSRLTPAGLAGLKNHVSTLSCLLHPETGGIVDDTIITRIGPQSFYVVTNAGCREKDLAYLKENIDTWHEGGGAKVEWDVMEDQGLVALQGPLASNILEQLLVDVVEDKLDNLHFGQSKYIRFRSQTGQDTAPFLVSRGGYTGEDGFEISIPLSETTPFVEFLLTTAGPEKLRLAGLGARDSLRLEAGMCLYGHDLDDTTTPVEAGLSWVIAKERRAEGGFHGAEIILQQLKAKKDGGTGVERRRIGLIVEGAPAREGVEIVDTDNNSIGKITSGCPSPTLRQNIAMGYVQSGHQKPGTALGVIVRGKRRNATVTKMPFVPSKYWKGGLTPG